MLRRIEGRGAARYRTARCTVLLALVLGWELSNACAQTLLEPVGRDGSTDLHFLAGMAGGLVTAALVENLLPVEVAGSSGFAPATALYSATVAGIGKELLDSTGFGVADFPDILFTAGGGVVAGIMVAIVEDFFPQAHQNDRTVLYLSTAALLSIPVAVGGMREIERFVGRLGGSNP